MDGKTCTKCRIDKPLFDFRRNDRYAGGRVTVCKTCQRDYQRLYASGKIPRRVYKHSDRPRKVARLPDAIAHRINRIVDEIQAYGQQAVWQYGSPDLSVNGTVLKVAAKCFTLDGREIPLSAEAVLRALKC